MQYKGIKNDEKLRVITFGTQDCPNPETEHIKITTAALAIQKPSSFLIKPDRVTYMLAAESRLAPTLAQIPAWTVQKSQSIYYKDTSSIVTLDGVFSSRQFQGLHLTIPARGESLRDSQYTFAVVCNNVVGNCDVKVRIEWECTTEKPGEAMNTSNATAPTLIPALLLLGLLAGAVMN